jgi:hypothetical protein
MAADTEFQLVRRFHAGVKATPEQDARVKTQQGNRQNRILRAWLPQKYPCLIEDVLFAFHLPL